MQKTKNTFQHIAIVSHLVKWVFLVIPVSLTVSSVVALFLRALDKATNLRFANGWLVWLFLLAGVVYVLPINSREK